MADDPQPRIYTPSMKPHSPLIVGLQARDDWIRWQEDCADYSINQYIPAKPAAMQLALCRMAFGPEGNNQRRNRPTPLGADGNPLALTELTSLIAMLEIAVVGEVNTTYERYVSRCRMQHDDETVDEFITALHELMKTCSVCEHMQDKFLKGQVVFGLTNSTTRERGLTLHKCLDMCRAAESATKQAKEIINTDIHYNLTCLQVK